MPITSDRHLSYVEEKLNLARRLQSLCSFRSVFIIHSLGHSIHALLYGRNPTLYRPTCSFRSSLRICRNFLPAKRCGEGHYGRCSIAHIPLTVERGVGSIETDTIGRLLPAAHRIANSRFRARRVNPLFGYASQRCASDRTIQSVCPETKGNRGGIRTKIWAFAAIRP